MFLLIDHRNAGNVRTGIAYDPESSCRSLKFRA